VVKTIPLGGQGLWDRMAVDTAARRLYVPRDTHIAVLDADSGSVVGDVLGLQGVHGVALAPELGRGFASNGRANTVTIFDLKTFNVIATARTGRKPDAVVYDRSSNLVFSLNLNDQSITAIDAGFTRALATILDSNITTFIAAAVLFFIGTGPVRGFAVTLGIGIITTVFTAFTLTRLIVAWWVQWKRPKTVPI